MKLDIQAKQTKTHMFWVRVDNTLFDKIEVLVRQHKTDRSVVVRKLIELGLEKLKSNE